MKRMNLALAAAIAMAGVAGGSAFEAKATAPRVQITQRQTKRQMLRDAGFGPSYRRRGPGWTQAQVQRMAKKARNVKRNRRAHRG